MDIYQGKGFVLIYILILYCIIYILFYISFIVAGLIPYIKRKNPNAKIIYRSHIESKYICNR